MKDTLNALVRAALEEDASQNDVTSAAIFGNGGGLKEAHILARQNLVLSGLDAMAATFHVVSPQTKVVSFFKNGNYVQKGKTIAKIRGLISELLAAERVALNFLQHLSGIATLTSLFVEKVKPYRCQILDTRKTIPGLRMLEKKAVVDGGGHNHRMNLADHYLIKDNHIAVCGGIREAIRRVKEKMGEQKNNQRQRRVEGGKSESFWRSNVRSANVTKPKEGALPAPLIEVEAKNIQEVAAALEEGVDIILLDNMSATQIKQAVGLISGKCLVEVSGGVNLKNVGKIAQTGVARISIGVLTHSAPAVDISMEVE